MTNKNLQDIYVSTDIEADGEIPGKNSMLSFGSAAYLSDKTILSTFSINLETLPEATSDPVTMQWWQGFPTAWQACRKNPISPEIAMKQYGDWLENLPGHIIFVAYPVAYDFRFIDYYLQRFFGRNPFKYRAIDIRSYAMGMLNLSYKKANKQKLPVEWKDNLPHTHIALDDALEHGALFCNMLLQQKYQR
jgi:DNA polymerase III alpha subunit (gram-positive type)